MKKLAPDKGEEAGIRQRGRIRHQTEMKNLAPDKGEEAGTRQR